MIQRTVIDGRSATVADYRGMAKIMFDDGEVVFGIPDDAPMARADAFDPNEARDPSGKWTAGAGGSKAVPDEPGKAAIPEGRERRFHYTSSKNVDSIRREGIKVSHSQGKSVGDPVAVWSNPDNPFPSGIPDDRALVEYHEDPKAHAGNPYAQTSDVPPENIVGIHEPWHDAYRYAKENGLKSQDLRDAGGEKYERAAQEMDKEVPETGMLPVKPEAFVEARDKSKRSQFLSAHPASELGDHKLFMNKEGTVGVSVDPKGDIQNVFNNGGPKGGGHKAMVAAIAAGGRTLDCYDSYLPGLYHQFGFEEDSRMKFNPEFAPAGWDFDKLGMPDIVFMSWRGYKPGGAQGTLDRMAAHRGKWPPPERSKVYGDDWDKAKQGSRDAAAAADAGGAGDHRVHAAVQGRDPADRAGDQSRSGAGEGDRRSVTSTPAFRAWFRDSKIVDGEGKPLVVYKGMHAYDYTKEKDGGLGPEITSIQRPTPFPDFNKGGEKEPDVHIAGFFGDKETANKFLFGEHSSIFPVYLSIQKPFVIDAKGKPAGHSQFGPEGKPFRDAIRSGRYDGVVIKNTKDEGDVYVPLDPHQIKSAIGNKGTFNPASVNIADSVAADDFDPSEPRDEGGKWTEGGGGGGAAAKVSPAKEPPKDRYASNAEWKNFDVEMQVGDKDPTKFKWPARAVINPSLGQAKAVLANAPFNEVQAGFDKDRNFVLWNFPRTMNEKGGTAALEKAGITGVSALMHIEDEKTLADLPQQWFASEVSPAEREQSEKRRAEYAALVAEEKRKKDETAATQAKITSSPAFKKWFGKSKVVDKAGNPLRAYHGTTMNFVKFMTALNKPEARKPGSAYSGELGAWFAAPSLHQGNYDEGGAEFLASSFAGENFDSGEEQYEAGANVMPVFLSIKKPMEFDEFEELLEARDEEFKGNAHKMRKALIKEGYDGVVVRNSMTDGNTDRDDWVAFYPEQIKSATGNKGTFDPKSAVITDSMFAFDGFDPNEPRDQGGKWTSSGGGGAGKADLGEYTASYSGTKGQYDKRYFKVEKDELKDDDGTVVGTKEKTVPIRPIRSQVPAEPQAGVIFRGMSSEEFADAMKAGRIKSAGDYNMSSQQGLTYFSTDPKSAGSYASSFAPAKHKPSFDRPAYVVAVKRPADDKISKVKGTAEDEVGVNASIPNTDIVGVYRGNVIATGLVGPELHWEKLETPTAAKQVETPAFKKWFGDSKIVDEDGHPQVMYHGTLGDFDSFDKAKASTEGNWGAGFYFTNDPEDLSHNYAGHGPDITGRLESLAEEIENNDAEMEDSIWENADPDERHKLALAEAAKRLDVRNEGAAMPVFLKMDHPFKVGGHDETFLDFELPYDEEADEYGEPTGKAWDFIKALKDLSENEDYFDRKDIAKFADSLSEHLIDNDGIRASDLEDAARKSEDLAYVTDENGKLVQTDIIRKALQAVGFDGIIDTKVSQKFPKMQGMKPTVAHYIAFEPTQIKSAIGNKGTFDPKSKVITDSQPVPMRELVVVAGLHNGARGSIEQPHMQDSTP